ncbi:MAG: Sir2 family NAD-dependent protein deacetylase [Chitinophagales bacterium]
MKELVVLTGAGISAESGIKTFRDSDGLWENHRIEDVASPEGWVRNKKLVLEFYNQRRRDVQRAKPNAAHLALAKLEDHFNVRIITQNVDDLHERAGSKQVMHLHGELLKVRSVNNDNLVLDWRTDLMETDRGPDGAPLRPHIVWFGEDVPLIHTAAQWVSEADILLIIGTSLQVYPAAGLLHAAAYEGNNIRV